MPIPTQDAAASRTIGRSALGSAAGILASRCCGLLRDMAYAAYWGATGIAQGAYHTAFAIPNHFRALFAEGAFTSVFVPMLSRHLAEDDREGAWRLADRAISIQILALAAAVLAVSVPSLLLWWFGLFQKSPTTRLTLLILPLLMPFAILTCAQGAFSALLNCVKSFLLPTSLQSVFNLIQIAAIGVLALFWRNDQLIALLLFCLSTLLAGAVQLAALMLAARRKGYRFHFAPVWRDEEVQTLCRKMVPGLLGAGVTQFNNLIDKGLGLWLGSAAIGALHHSQRLVYLPTGLFGAAMGIACLPAISRATARHDDAEVVSSTSFALRLLLFLTLPCTALLLATGTDLVTILFARGAFQTEAIRESAWALQFYLLGLPAFCCVKVAVAPFHARLDTKTPMLVSFWMVGLNLVLNLTLMQFLRQGGLALATAICSWINLISLLALNRHHTRGWSPLAFLLQAIPLLLAAAAAGAAAFGARHALLRLAVIQNLARFPKSLALFCGAGAAAAIAYLLACLLLRRPELIEVRRLTRRAPAPSPAPQKAPHIP